MEHILNSKSANVKRIFAIPRIGKNGIKSKNKSLSSLAHSTITVATPIIATRNNVIVGQPEVIDSIWHSPNPEKEAKEVLELWRNLRMKVKQEEEQEEQLTNNQQSVDLTKVKKFKTIRSSFFGPFEDGKVTPFVFYTKGNEFLGGPGKK